MGELQSKKALRRHAINPDDLPQIIKDKYDELLDRAALLSDDQLGDDERTEIEVEVTAKDENVLRLVRRHARDLQAQKDNEASRDGKKKKTSEDEGQPRKGVFNRYL